VSDGISTFLRLLTNGLGAGHPIRLLCGVSLGLLARIAISVLAKLYPDNLFWATLNEYTAAWYVVIITPLLFISLVFGRRGALEAPIQQINTVRLLIEEGDFSIGQQRLFWRSLVEKYIKSIQPNLSRSPSLTDFSGQAIDELRGEGDG
jgi:hypothetical protein